MECEYYSDPIARERIVKLYLSRTLEAASTQRFEDHYLACDDCFEEMRATELILAGLRQPVIETVQAGDVTVIRFTAATELTGGSSELNTLARMMDARGDTKVLIDLQRVSRIDSTGLGMLMQCYTHSVRNAGALKLVQPEPHVRRVLSLTKIDSVVPTFDDEAAALNSFR